MGTVWLILEGLAALVKGVLSLLELALRNQKKLENYHSVDAKNGDDW